MPSSADPRALHALQTSLPNLSPAVRRLGGSPPPSPFAPLARPFSSRRSSRKCLTLLLGLALTLCTALLLQLRDDGAAAWTLSPKNWLGRTQSELSSLITIPRGGKPSGKFRDSLRSDRRYITAFSLSGFNNQVLGAMNLLHLTYLLHLSPYPLPHTAILPPITPHYVHLHAEDQQVDSLDLGRIFDLRRFEEAVGFGVVEWGEVKDVGSVTQGGEREEIACWSTWWTQFQTPLSGAEMEEKLGLQSTLTPLPPSLLSPYNRAPNPFLLPSLANLLNPPDNPTRSAFLSGLTGEAQGLLDTWGWSNESWTDVWGPQVDGWKEPEGGNLGGVACFDTLYFVSERGEEIRELYEGRASAHIPKEYGPWFTVGRHLHFQDHVVQLAKGVVRNLLGLGSKADLPDFVSMHIRRGDFLESCPEESKPCFPVSQYAKHLLTLKEKLHNHVDPSAKSWPVIVTTDESDPSYLSALTAEGWLVVDHSALWSVEGWGKWYPTVVDNAILSLGKGFLGTADSTMSILALRRVVDWNGGLGELVPLVEEVHLWQGP